MRKLLRLLLTFIIASCTNAAMAQPANDNCDNASVITIGSGGFALGNFTGTQYDISAATLQSGETFAPGILTAGLSKKSIWYKFSIPTTRSVEVFLKQPSVAIADGEVGFAVYKTNNCLPANADISTKLTPIAKFASSKHPCLEAGDYMVQVSANNNASGLVFISLDVADPDPAPYDKPSSASMFGKVNSNVVTAVEFDVSCQSIDNAAEVCFPNTSFKDFTKSTWHTFTTPDYFDYIAIMVAGNTNNYWDQTQKKIGFRLFEGDISTTPLTSLTQIGGCDSMYCNTYLGDKRLFKCGTIKPNTTYTVQLLYSTLFSQGLRFGVAPQGTAVTRAPEPLLTIPASNKLGVLPSSFAGIATTATKDYFACNARHDNYSCPKALPASGIAIAQDYNIRYNLSTFFSFTLATTANINIYATSSPRPYGRLYRQGLVNSCSNLDTANIVAEGFDLANLVCMTPGDYLLQLMGTDSAYVQGIASGNVVTGSSVPQWFRNLGQSVGFRIDVQTQQAINKFSLNTPGAFEKINANAMGVMQPVEMYKTYTTEPDTLGCANTVLVSGHCGYDKGSFREFVVADSGVFRVEAGVYGYVDLYKGDANALAVAQNAFTYPEKITGLTTARRCMWNVTPQSTSTCITPGTFSLVALGPMVDARNGASNILKPAISFIAPKPRFNAPDKAQDMGDLWAQLGTGGGVIGSDIDTFTCYDNPAIIDGQEGCSWGFNATKLIYRQFYLSKPASLRIWEGGYPYPNFSGYLTLFSGKATDGIAALKTMGDFWKCFYDKSINGCEELPAGWYTVVAYGHGGSFEKPLQTTDAQGNHYSTIGLANAFYVQLYPKTCASPQFNRPHKGSVDTVTKKPYLIQWGPQTGHSAAYPNTAKAYTLVQENFNCSQDTAFIRQHVTPCPGDNAKLAFYIFQVTQESYVRINTQGLWSQVYAFDARTADSTKLKTQAPLQPCMNKAVGMDFCKLQPGYYTLIIYAPSTYSCNGVQPIIFVDQVGYSRFDHANNAYDFGAIKPDSAWYNGKPGDVNPLNSSRAPSNDFFYCTTGAQEKDPNYADCYLFYNPNIYKAGNNNVIHSDNWNAMSSYSLDRRNLWYTFTVNQPGTVRIKVGLPTIGKNYMGGCTIFSSDVDGSLSFSNVVSQGLVDSTLAQGLSYVSKNFVNLACWPHVSQDWSFFIPPCDFKPTRYYILLESSSNYPYDYARMDPNFQAEVSVLLDSISAAPPKFDHFSQANDMGVVNSGKKQGATDNFTCATRDQPDPLMYLTSQCQKTLWYKFTTTVTGTIRYAAFFKNTNNYYYDHIQLFRQIRPGDSSANGLLHLSHTTAYSNNGTWAEQCISPGTYYIILPGCVAVNEDVYPEIEIIPQAGDFCSNPLIATLSGVGNSTATVKVDCHTIGTDYGEFNQTLTCPDGKLTRDYKTSWYRLDVKGTDTLDITVYINEKTNASSPDIKYRMMTGSCGAMQEQSCVEDALTRNTYECMIPGKSYYIQVFTPVSVGGTTVNGDIDLNISSVKHVTTCAPANNCIAVAEFSPKFDCTKDRNISITNLSTFGSDIKYDWDFGYNNQKSNAVAPEFFYPALTTDKTYTITLTVTNTVCGKQDVTSKQIVIPARPAVNLGNDTVICNSPASRLLDATSHNGTTYQWYSWIGYWNPTSTASSLNVTTLSSIIVDLTYNNCKARDTVNVWINPITKKALQTQVLCKVDKINLSANRGSGEQFKWNTGSVANNIDAYAPGYYWCDLYLNGCTIRDSFLVINPTGSQQKRDVTVCQKAMPYTYDAIVSGASSYAWNDNSGAAKKTISSPGLYWVDINLSGCTYRDTLIVSVDSFKTNAVSARICGGQSYTLPSGKMITTTGVFKDSLKNIRGCDSIITTLTLKVDSAIRKNVNTSVCLGQSYTLPSGRSINIAGAYVDTVRYISGCDSIITNLNLLVATSVRNNLKDTTCFGKSYLLPSGKTVNTSGNYSDTLRAKAGCDSVINTIELTVLSPINNTINTSICFGKTLTLPSGKIVSTTGLHRDTIRYTKGCDSLISNFTLSVGSPVRENKSIAICQGQTYTLPSGKVVNTTASYNDTARATGGCDSLISVVDLVIQNVTDKTISDYICAGKTYALPSGKMVNASGVYLDTIRYKAGCDSIRYSVSLEVFDVIVNNRSTSICAGSTYALPSGTIINTAGVFKDTIRYNSGCDSLISNITLLVGSPVRENKPVLICQGQSYTLPSGTVVNSSGNYNDTVRSVGFCDSMISVIDLTVQNVSSQSINDFICGGKAYTLPSGKIVNSTGLYLDTLRYKSGCDSIRFSINLKVFDVIINNQSVSICAGKTYTLTSGSVVNTTGLFRDTIRYSNGCDSLISNVNLTVGQPIRENKRLTICDGQSLQLPSGRVVIVAGSYSDTVTAVGGCDSLISAITLNVDVPQARSITTIICSNAVYTSPGGKQWSTAGTYRDTIRNIRGCDSLQFVIDLKVQTVSRTIIDSSICNGVQFKLPSGKIITAAGTYIDTLRSSIGCDSIIITNLVVRPTLNVTVSGINSICEGNSTTLLATGSGGNGGPYSISWSGSTGNSNTITVSPITGTKYIATITDGCTIQAAKDSINIQVTPKPNATITASKTSGCEALQVTFGNGSTNLKRHWDFGTGSTADTSNRASALFTYTNAGTYTASLQVTTLDGCTNSSNTIITVYPTPQSDFVQPNPICAGNTVALSGIVNNATGITWSWNFGNGQTSSVQSPVAQRYAAAGNYQIDLVVKNTAGCSDTTSRRLIVQSIPVPGLANAQLKICLGSSITLQAKDGLSYSWSPAISLSNPTVANPTASPTIDTRYSVLVTNAGGCVSADSLHVKVTQPFTLRASSDTLVCFGKSVTLNATGAQRFAWSGAGNNQNTNSIAVKPNITSTYTITGYGVDSCFIQSKSITVTVIPLPTVNAGNDTTIMVGSSFTLLPSYSNDVSEWRWTPSEFLDCDDCPSPVTTPRSEIKYLLTVRNRYQCEASDTRTIKLLCNTESVFLPNTFTPNGDGMNDVWYPRGNGIQSIRYLKVFNRWGQLIFERSNFNSDDRAAGWDGMFKGQLLPPDVFVYSLGMICDNGQTVESKGNVMIVR